MKQSDVNGWSSSPVGLDLGSYEDPRVDDPFDDVNLDLTGENEGGTQGYPRRMTDESFDPGSISDHLGSSGNICQVCGQDMGAETDMCPFCLNGAQAPQADPREAAVQLDHLIGYRGLEPPRMLPVLSINRLDKDPYAVEGPVQDQSYGKCVNCGGDVKTGEGVRVKGGMACGVGCAMVHAEKNSRKTARADFSTSEKLALIDEDGEASNSHKLDLEGTHYVSGDPGMELSWGLGFGF